MKLRWFSVYSAFAFLIFLSCIDFGANKPSTLFFVNRTEVCYVFYYIFCYYICVCTVCSLMADVKLVILMWFFCLNDQSHIQKTLFQPKQKDLHFSKVTTIRVYHVHASSAHSNSIMLDTRFIESDVAFHFTLFDSIHFSVKTALVEFSFLVWCIPSCSLNVFSCLSLCWFWVVFQLCAFAAILVLLQ